MFLARKLTFAMQQQQHLIRRFSPILNCRHLAKLQTPSDSFKHRVRDRKKQQRNGHKSHNICGRWSPAAKGCSGYGRREASGAYYSTRKPRSRRPAPDLASSAGDERGRNRRTNVLTNYLTHQPQKDPSVLVGAVVEPE